MAEPASAAVTDALAGRHAIVTGASRGIGAAIAGALAVRGADVTLMGRDRAALDGQLTRLRALGASGKHAVAPADLRDEASLAAGFQAARDGLGPAAILINNAGVAPSAPLLKQSLAGWNEVLA